MQPTIRRLVRDAGRHRTVGLALGAVNQRYWAARCHGGTDKTTHGHLPLCARYLGPIPMRRNLVLDRSPTCSSCPTWRRCTCPPESLSSARPPGP